MRPSSCSTPRADALWAADLALLHPPAPSVRRESARFPIAASTAVRVDSSLSGPQVPVSVERRLSRGVPQSRLHNLDIGTGRDQQRGEVVAKIVVAEVRR